MRRIGTLGFGLVLACAVTISGCGGDTAGSPGGGGGVGFGGAQDIGQFRNILEAGDIPGPSTLDANGFFSEHRTELPPPDCGQTLCSHGMLAVGRSWVSDDYQATLQVALNTPIDPSSLVRKPLDMVVVVDTSGSMAGDDRIDYVRQGLHILVDELTEGDRLAVVTYSDNAQVRRTLSEGSDIAGLHEAIDELDASGSTNIFDGLELGFLQASENIDLERQSRVVLLSDGVATAGDTSDANIIRMASQYIAEGIGLTTIGVGLSFNVDLMRGLSERGAGNFYFVESADAVTEVFTEELDYFVTPIATSVSIQFESTPGYTMGDVAGTRLWKTQETGGEVFLPAVFVASRIDDENPNGRRGGGSAIFVDLDPDSGIADPGPVANVRLSYLVPGDTERTESVITIENPMAPGELAEDLFVSRAAMAEHYAVYNVYLGLYSATRYAELANYNCAAANLEAIRQQAVIWNRDAADTDVRADIELIEKFQANLIARGVNIEELPADCPSIAPDYEFDPGTESPDPGPGYGNEPHACSATGVNGGWAGMLILLALALGIRRRRTSV